MTASDGPPDGRHPHGRHPHGRHPDAEGSDVDPPATAWPASGGAAPERPGTPDGGLFEWARRGQDLLERGDAGPATVLLEHAAEEAPESASVCEALARAYYDAGRYQQAADGFRRLLTLTPTSDYGHFGLGLALTRLDRFELAVEHLSLAVAMRPDRPEYVDRLRQARATIAARRDAQGTTP